MVSTGNQLGGQESTSCLMAFCVGFVPVGQNVERLFPAEVVKGRQQVTGATEQILLTALFELVEVLKVCLAQLQKAGVGEPAEFGKNRTLSSESQSGE